MGEPAHEAPPQDATRRVGVPTSGQLLAVCADLLGLRGVAAEQRVLTGRTAQRYFAGERDPHVVKPAEVAVIQASLARALITVAREVSADLPASAAPDALAGSIAQLAALWDTLAGMARHARGGAHRDLLLGSGVRVDVFVDAVATRTAAWAVMTRASDTFVGPFDGGARTKVSSPLDEHATASLLRRLYDLAVLRTANRRAVQRHAREDALNVSRLAKRAKVGRAPVADLLSGRRLPHGPTIDTLAPVLWTAIVGPRSDRAKDVTRVAAALRSHYAVVRLVGEMKDALGNDEAGRLFATWLAHHRLYVRALRAVGQRAPLPEGPEQFRTEMWRLLLNGTTPLLVGGLFHVATTEKDPAIVRFLCVEALRHLVTSAVRLLPREIVARIAPDAPTAAASLYDFVAGAASALTEARMERAPDRPDALAEHGMMLVAAHQHAEAIPLVERALQHRPDDWKLRVTLAVALVHCGRVSEGEAHLDLLRDVPDAAHALHSERASLLLARGDERAALAEYEEVLKLDDRDPVALAGAAECHARLGDAAAARRRRKLASKLGALPYGRRPRP